MGVNVTKERVLKDVLQHSQSKDTSFHIERASSRVSGVHNKADKAAIKEHLQYWVDEGIIEQRKQGVFWVPHDKRDAAQEILDTQKYGDLTVERR